MRPIGWAHLGEATFDDAVELHLSLAIGDRDRRLLVVLLGRARIDRLEREGMSAADMTTVLSFSQFARRGCPWSSLSNFQVPLPLSPAAEAADMARPTVAATMESNFGGMTYPRIVS